MLLLPHVDRVFYHTFFISPLLLAIGVYIVLRLCSVQIFEKRTKFYTQVFFISIMNRRNTIFIRRGANLHNSTMAAKTSSNKKIETYFSPGFCSLLFVFVLL